MSKPNDQITVIPNHEASFWLQMKKRGLVQHMAAGLVRHCGHLQHPETQVGVVALCQPQLIVRQSCQPRLIPDEPEDRTCDRCRTYCPDGLHTAGVKPRPTSVILFGLCHSCHVKESGQ